MAEQLADEFPLFPLGLVALPGELIPLHIFEERYKTMMALCLEGEREFGIVWMSDDGLRDVGCAVRIEQVLEKLDDGRMNVLVRGTRPLRVVERQGHLAYPAGVVEFLADKVDEPDAELATGARAAYADLGSENARLRLVTRLFRAASKRLDFVDRAQARARSNGKVRF
jgi:Lon protease-like protein